MSEQSDNAVQSLNLLPQLQPTEMVVAEGPRQRADGTFPGMLTLQVQTVGPVFYPRADGGDPISRTERFAVQIHADRAPKAYAEACLPNIFGLRCRIAGRLNGQSASVEMKDGKSFRSRLAVIEATEFELLESKSRRDPLAAV